LFVTLKLREPKDGAVYRFIHNWEAIPSSHRDDAYYLFLHVDVQWGKAKDRLQEVFTIVMQYSATIGHKVSLSQPAHVLVSDVEEVQERFAAFVRQARKRA